MTEESKSLVKQLNNFEKEISSIIDEFNHKHGDVEINELSSLEIKQDAIKMFRKIKKLVR